MNKKFNLTMAQKDRFFENLEYYDLLPYVNRLLSWMTGAILGTWISCLLNYKNFYDFISKNPIADFETFARLNQEFFLIWLICCLIGLLVGNFAYVTHLLFADSQFQITNQILSQLSPELSKEFISSLYSDKKTRRFAEKYETTLRSIISRLHLN